MPRTTNKKVLAFVEEAKALFKPESVYWCDGSKDEYQAMLKALVDGGTALWLNPDKRPNSILVRSDPKDVARVPNRRTYAGLVALQVHLRARRNALFQDFLELWRDYERKGFAARLAFAISERAQSGS